MAGVFEVDIRSTPRPRWNRRPSPPRAPDLDANLDPVTFARTRLHFDPDPKQAIVLNSKLKCGILNCTRQWGKSTVTAAKAVHRVFTQPGSLVLVASQAAGQSGEFLDKAADMLHLLGIPRKGDGHHSLSLVLPNGSRIVGLPGNEGPSRGFSNVSMLIIDEAARVSEALYLSLLPVLAVSDGDLWMMSTPCGAQGFFYETWMHGGDEWERVEVPATECPRMPPARLERFRNGMVASWFRQEFMCEFVGDDSAVFSRALIDEAFDDSVEPLWENWPAKQW